jgi:hypothetical protein
VIDQDVVREEFEPTSTPVVTIGDDVFWRDEFTPGAFRARRPLRPLLV